ncbi:CAP domain-containing protein [Isoptericola croceus]|uniref:CAP domain-containing protein n=1 Tax=Isoptericola croceus TaxID=3031406 RepID=UPI0023F654DB|nr:CAP domain-containing protein [Isoptericola croceus]
MSRRRGRVSGLRQLAALLATFVAGLGLVLVTAAVAPGAIRISDHLASDDVSAAALTDVSQDLAEALVQSELADGGDLPVGGTGPDGGAGPDGDADSDVDETGDADDEADEDAGGADDEAVQTDEAEPEGKDSGTKDDAASETGTEDGAAPTDAGDPADVDAHDSDDTDGQPAPTGAAARVLELVNAERASAGCGALRADATLDDLGAAHSQDMAARNYFDHTTPDGLSPWDRADAAGVQGLGAENIARGQPDAAAVVAAWMDSPGHRANILSCDLTRHGLGVHRGAGGPWWTQVFGR